MICYSLTKLFSKIVPPPPFHFFLLLFFFSKIFSVKTLIIQIKKVFYPFILKYYDIKSQKPIVYTLGTFCGNLTIVIMMIYNFILMEYCQLQQMMFKVLITQITMISSQILLFFFPFYFVSMPTNFLKFQSDRSDWATNF